MAAADESMTDEDYLIKQVLRQIKTDPPAAKAWMIFSKSVFPQSFTVLFHCYKMECDEGNVTESAACLCDLISKFPKEKTLLEELRLIANALIFDNNDFLIKMFEQIPEEVKFDIMLAVTRSAQSIEEHCKLMLVFFKRMPNYRFLQDGSSIVNTLLSAEIQLGMQFPVNIYRKMLVCDALPLILRITECDNKCIYTLLQKAIEFYVCCLFFPLKEQVIPLFSAEDGWKPLLKLFEAVAIRLKWSHPEMFFSNFNELSLQKLISILKINNKLLASLTNEKDRCGKSGYEEAYFSLAVTFFFYLYTFGRQIHPKLFLDVITGPYNYVMMEGISVHSNECPKGIPKDFKQTDSGYVVVSKTGNQTAFNLLASSFVTIVECWEFLNKHKHFKRDFDNLSAFVKLDTWPVFQEFFVCRLMHSKIHKKASQCIELLRKVQNTTEDFTHKNKIALQIASCYYYLKDYEPSLKILFDIIVNLPAVYDSNPVIFPIRQCPARHVYFMRYNNSEIIQYCTSILLELYKSKEGKISGIYKDMAIGYMLVLMQYNIQNEYPLLNRCLQTIKQAKSFCFPKFFNFIIRVEILEEISNLATPDDDNVNLEILPTTPFKATRQRAVTRGVKKVAYADLKEAFTNQLIRHCDNLDNIFIDFFKEEHNYLLFPLNDTA